MLLLFQRLNAFLRWADKIRWELIATSNFKVPNNNGTSLFNLIVIAKVNWEGFFDHDDGSSSEEVSSSVKGAIKSENNEVSITVNVLEIPVIASKICLVV